jgi:hypothetical protein
LRALPFFPRFDGVFEQFQQRRIPNIFFRLNFDIPVNFAGTSQQLLRVGQFSAFVETEFDPLLRQNDRADQVLVSGAVTVTDQVRLWVRLLGNAFEMPEQKLSQAQSRGRDALRKLGQYFVGGHFSE